MSGYCRSTVFSVLIILALCVTAASAATLSNNLVVSKVTQTFELATTTAPAYAPCPSGYDCLTEADAAAQLGTYTKSSDAVCGYKQNTATAIAVIRTPQYCVKKTEITNTCPQGCSCMAESAAKDKFQGVYRKCGDQPCAMVVTGAAQISAYCFGPGTTTTTPSGTCKAGCSCISEATAKAKGGSWTHCSEEICGYEQSTATLAAVVQVPKYCMQQQETTPVCPDGCTCISDADAKLKGLTLRCDENEKPCGYQSPAATANIQGNQIPLYCYKTGITTITPTPVCPDNCGGCMNEADAKAKYGSFNYTRCSEKVCGYDQTATSNYAQPKYCFRPTVTATPTPQVCREGCYCVQEAEAKLKFGSGNYTRCDPNGQPCGYDQSAASANGIPRYCFRPTNGVTPTPTPAVCAYDARKNECTGICPDGKFCAITGKETDQQTGKETAVCGCPWNTCTYDYVTNACTGSCPVTGESCQMGTIYRDATTGKITYADCNCKGQGGTTQTSGTQQTCVLDANNRCSGTCSDGSQCTSVTTRDDSGQEKVSCGCGAGTPAVVATRPQGLLESIASFFSRLFGGK